MAVLTGSAVSAEFDRAFPGGKNTKGQVIDKAAFIKHWTGEKDSLLVSAIQSDKYAVQKGVPAPTPVPTTSTPTAGGSANYEKDLLHAGDDIKQKTMAGWGWEWQWTDKTKNQGEYIPKTDATKKKYKELYGKDYVPTTTPTETHTPTTSTEPTQEKPAKTTQPGSGQSGPPSFWNEQAYLDNYPDAAAAVKAGTYKSGWDHYQQYGINEQRIPGGWDEEAYLNQNPDVAQAIKNNTTPVKTGYEHFLRWGSTENRTPGGWDEQAYLDANPDVAQAIRDNTTPVKSGYEHYMKWGKTENRQLSNTPAGTTPPEEKPVPGGGGGGTGTTTFPEEWTEDWDRWRKMGKDFVGKQYDEMLQDLLEEKQLKEKVDRNDLDELKIRELESRTTFRGRMLDDYDRNLRETKGDYDETLSRMETDRMLWDSQEAGDYKEAVKIRKEEFNRRGLTYSGFQEEATGKQELERQEKMQAYEKAYQRQSGDITKEYQRTTGELQRGNTRAFGDYETAYTQKLNDWERKYGIQKEGETAYTYGYKKGEDIKYGVDYLGTETAGLESQGYKFFGVTPYETKQAYEKTTTQTERDRIAAEEEYAIRKRSEEKEEWEARRRKYYESQGYTPYGYAPK